MEPVETAPSEFAQTYPFARLPTGAKVFLILSGALLPLALIAMFATLQTTRIADQETRARLRIATIEASRALSIQLGGDLASLRTAVDAWGAGGFNPLACARATGVFAQRGGARFAIFDANGRVQCGGGVAVPTRTPMANEPVTVAFQDQGMVLGIADATGSVTAGVSFPSAFLDRLTEPSGFASEYGIELVAGDQRLALRTNAETGTFVRVERARQSLDIGDLAVELAVPSAAITSPLIVAMLLPLLMWAAAAGIAWFVVDRLLIRPLRRLRTQVGAFSPGGDFELDRNGSIPAQEIAELGETFRDIAQVVRLHEADLAEGLVRQTKLTREVHHRVKNNLQVIASLINFHARSAVVREAMEAYASIQRRVDALAVVHRYHFAELEVNRGLELRSVLSELASNIRATAPDEAAKLGIALDVEPVQVSQDVAVAVAFLATELIELAMQVDPVSQIRILVRAQGEAPNTASLSISAPALADTAELARLLDTRYGRVISGLARQLRSPLRHDPLGESYAITIATMGRS